MLRISTLLTASLLSAASIMPAAPKAAIQLSVSKKSAESPANFPGGPEALFTYLTKAPYPEAARAYQSVGRVFVQFEISPTGKVEKVKALVPSTPNTAHFTTDPVLLEAAAHLIAQMPTWQPATRNGNPIATTQTVPVDFYPSAPPIAETPVYAYAEQLPVFAGNTAKSPFPASVYRSLRYPAEALRNHIQGEVLLYFVVNEQGQTEQVEIIQSAHPILDAEAIRVIKAQVASAPAIHNGKPVKVFFTLPVKFAYR